MAGAAVSKNLDNFLVNLKWSSKIMKSIIVSIVAVAGLMIAGSALANDMPELAKKLGCAGCHAIDKKLVGPGWMEVSTKYKGAKTFSFDGKDYPLEEGLMMKISKGGKGNWGAMAMTPQDASGKKQAEIKELAKFVLGLAK